LRLVMSYNQSNITPHPVVSVMANVHLLVLIHGMWGNPGHLARMHEIVQQVKGNAENTGSGQAELAVLVAQTNRDEWTYDGIDWGGERVAEEVSTLLAPLFSRHECFILDYE